MLPSSLMKDFDVLQKFLIDMHQSSVFIYIYILVAHKFMISEYKILIYSAHKVQNISKLKQQQIVNQH